MLRRQDMKKDLHEKLETIRKEIGQTIVVHIGLPAKGQYDILGVECCGSTQKKQKKNLAQEIISGTSTPHEEVQSYIG